MNFRGDEKRVFDNPFWRLALHVVVLALGAVALWLSLSQETPIPLVIWGGFTCVLEFVFWFDQVRNKQKSGNSGPGPN